MKLSEKFVQPLPGICRDCALNFFLYLRVIFDHVYRSYIVKLISSDLIIRMTQNRLSDETERGNSEVCHRLSDFLFFTYM